MKKALAKKLPVFQQISRFVYETNIHSRTPRSGFWFLGSGQQSVAEHLFHTAMIAYALASLDKKVDKNKAVIMALFHDIGEGRTSDHNYVHQRYGRLSETNALADMARGLFFGHEILALFEEEQAKVSPEAKLVKDADQLEWISTLRAEEVKGNVKAKKWISIAQKRLKTPNGKRLGKFLATIHPDEWWFDDKDKWFVDRLKEFQDWGGKKKNGRKV